MSRRKLPITVIVPVRNEAGNLGPCLESVRGFDQVIVVDSGSTDETAAIAQSHGAEVHQFRYTGGWPKKRQWAMETLAIRNRWTLLLDADERVTTALRRELAEIVKCDGPADGYWIALRLVFLGRALRHGGGGLRKLSFFRTGRARFECLVREQTPDMADMEIHEHLILDGREAHCRHALLHENENDLSRYIQKHNEYSSWSAAVAVARRGGRPAPDARGTSPAGNQADRRRWLTDRLWRMPAAGILLPVLRFLYFYLIRLGFLDGRAGFYYCGFKAVQAFHTMAKVAEIEAGPRGRRR